MKVPSISLATVIWPIVLGLGAVAIIGFATFEPDMFSRMARTLNPWIMLGALAMVGSRILMGGFRLSYVSQGRLPLRGGIKGQLAWDFASNITPSLVGGAPIAAYYISKQSSGTAHKGVRIGEVTAFMMFILLLDQTWFTLSVPVLLVAAMFIEVIPSSAGAIGSYVALLYFILFMVWTVLFAYATLFRPELLGRFVDQICRIRFLRKYRERARQEMEDYTERAGALRSQPVSFFVRGLLLTGLTWISRYFLVVFIVWSVFPSVDKFLLFMRSVAMTISALIVPTPGGAGGIEALYALYYSSLMPSAYLAPTLVVWRILGYYIFLGIGVFMSTHQIQKSIRRKRKMAVADAMADRNSESEMARDSRIGSVMNVLEPASRHALIDAFDFRSVHPNLLFGTASDRYAGWIGQIYSDKWISQVKKRGRKLGGVKFEERTVPIATSEEYFEHFSVLEVDFTFYRSLRGPVGAPSNIYFVLQQYADAAPENARFILKAPQQVTARILPRGSTGTPSYEENDDFLNVDIFQEGFLAPAREILGDRLSGVIFEQEYQRKANSPDPIQNVEELDRFFSSITDATPIHLELRSPHLLVPSYFKWLKASGLGFVFSHWTWLPPLREQWKLIGEEFSSSSKQFICRLLTPLRMPYTKAYGHAHPFDKPVAELSETEQAKNMVIDTAALFIQSLKHDYAAMIISNNRAWGNAPSLAQKVAKRILKELDKEEMDQPARA